MTSGPSIEPWPLILKLHSFFLSRSDSVLTVSTTSLKTRVPVSEISGVSSVVYPIIPTFTLPKLTTVEHPMNFSISGFDLFSKTPSFQVITLVVRMDRLKTFIRWKINIATSDRKSSSAIFSDISNEIIRKRLNTIIEFMITNGHHIITNPSHKMRSSCTFIYNIPWCASTWMKFLSEFHGPEVEKN